MTGVAWPPGARHERHHLGGFIDDVRLRRQWRRPAGRYLAERTLVPVGRVPRDHVLMLADPAPRESDPYDPSDVARQDGSGWTARAAVRSSGRSTSADGIWFRGWAWVPSDPEHRLTLDVTVDGVVVGRHSGPTRSRSQRPGSETARTANFLRSLPSSNGIGGDTHDVDLFASETHVRVGITKRLARLGIDALASPTLGDAVALHVLCGTGIELGALDKPQAVGPEATVRYVDRLPTEDLRVVSRDSSGTNRPHGHRGRCRTPAYDRRRQLRLRDRLEPDRTPRRIRSPPSGGGPRVGSGRRAVPDRAEPPQLG